MANQFPDPSVTTDYTAPNGTQYSYDPIDKKWIAVGFIDPILPDIDDDNQQIETIDDRYANVLGETLTGHLNVLEPVEDLNAASKAYVDNAITGDYLEHDGDTMTGYLEVPTPSEDNQVVNIDYVDTILDGKVSKVGDEMTGTLTFKADPTELEPVVYKFNPCIVELTERPGENVTTTLDLGTDFFYIDDNVEIKDSGEFKFSSVTKIDNVIVSNTSAFNLNNLLEVTRDTEDSISYQGSVVVDKEIVTKEYIDNIINLLEASVPVGTIFFWASTKDIPEDYFKCDGATFDRNVYVDLHNVLLGMNGYSAGRLPNFSNRYACHVGDPNGGVPGGLLSDTNSFTGTTNGVGMTMTQHKHNCSITGGNHSHTYTLTGSGNHTHTYTAYNRNADGGKVGKDANPYVFYALADGPKMESGSHTHTVDLDRSHDHNHTVTIASRGNLGTHSHTISYTGSNTTRPLTFLGYWIIKNK